MLYDSIQKRICMLLFSISSKKQNLLEHKMGQVPFVYTEDTI